MQPLILHIPHASTRIPFMDGYVLSRDELEREMHILTDWYTDDLFDNDRDEIIKAGFSRIFCDPERFRNDEDEEMARVGMGVLYTETDDRRLMRRVTPALRNRILSEYYDPHHAAFSMLVQEHLAKYRKALIVDCHSFPENPLQREKEQDPDRPDFNIGTDKHHTPTHLVEASVNYFDQQGYSMVINKPFSGTIVPMDFYKKDDNVHSIMLEVNRKLYMDESTLDKSGSYGKIREVVQGFLSLMRNLN